MSEEAYNLFRNLADTEDDFTAEGDTIILIHHGIEHCLTLSHIPSVGTALRSLKPLSESEWVPVQTYIQRDILNLPVLARQIAKTLQSKHKEQGIEGFIEGSAEVQESPSNTAKQSFKAKDMLKKWLTIPSFGNTQLIELMAPAGQGKTVLLEHIALDAAISYQPDPVPLPLLLVVDLLGRYVGTIHDAIAGSLSNTYTFPGLTGRDVAFCLRQRWLNLALDGYDELVARVGTREAFLRTKELVDELEESGTVVLSARDTFFHLFEIEASIRTYLQPLRGNYSIKTINLKQWGEDQGRKVFRQLGSSQPEEDLRGLLDTFADDRELVFRAFFTIRLAKAWLEGERFGKMSTPHSQLDRWNYVIRVFLEREVTEKWRTREGIEPLSIENHVAVLGAIAEEMWRSGAFSLMKEEVDIAGRIALSTPELGLNSRLVDDIAARLPTHGVFSSDGKKGVKFLHESFFSYVLGQRLGTALVRHDKQIVASILKAGELAPLVIQWAVWRTSIDASSAVGALTWLVGKKVLLQEDQNASSNIGSLLGCAAREKPLRDLTVTKIAFVGEALKEVTLEKVRFKNCEISMADLCKARFENCEFDNCNFATVLLNRNTAFPGTYFRDCKFHGIEVEDGSIMYDPAGIALLLEQLGASIKEEETSSVRRERRRRSVSVQAIHCLDKFRRAKTWDIELHKMETRYGEVARNVYKLGLAKNVFREIKRDTSGKKKQLFRFAVNRELLLTGQLGPTSDERIDQFWEEMERIFPDR